MYPLWGEICRLVYLLKTKALCDTFWNWSFRFAFTSLWLEPPNSVRVCNPLGYTLKNRIAMGVHTMHVYALELALVSAHKSPSTFCRLRVTGCYNFSLKVQIYLIKSILVFSLLSFERTTLLKFRLISQYTIMYLY